MAKQTKSAKSAAPAPVNAEVKSDEVVLNMTEIENEVKRSAVGEAMHLINTIKAQRIPWNRIIFLGHNNFSRLNPMSELVKSPQMGGLISSLAEKGWNYGERNVVLRPITVTPKELDAHKTMLNALSGHCKKIDMGLYGIVHITPERYAEFIAAKYPMEAIDSDQWYELDAGYRRGWAIIAAALARDIAKLAPLTELGAIVVPEETTEAVLTEINILENAQNNRGLEDLRAPDRIKSAFLILEKDPMASKTSVTASLAIPRATAEKYYAMARLGQRFPGLGLCLQSGAAIDSVPTRMVDILGMFGITSHKTKELFVKAVEGVYSFKGITSSSEVESLVNGRLAPGFTVDKGYPKNLLTYKEDFAKWIKSREESINTACVDGKASLVAEAKELLKPDAKWEQVSSVAAVGYLLFKSGVLATDEKKAKAVTVSKSKVVETAGKLRDANLGAIASVMEAVADGDDDLASSRSAELAAAGPAIEIVIRLVSRLGKTKVVELLQNLEDNN